ncbi:non-specific lipid-transfer protein 3-like [Selaginella moellendorffii]|uniref:non-specific lipid-transfer protein 3-like n=1 Tax=Selaginella moellendorffii TaxID=88036 RepID=UPI000D1C587F|nr:non-specific lipid-transfer protein 3-like [Selaginella moellendorffii]|eukprot:XP_024544581.1 non-specific lipid-transfer protein 3-like [Selaginella moellendorffii]
MAPPRSGIAILLIAILCIALLPADSSAQSCTNYLTLASCIPAAVGNTAPTANCCSLIQKYVKKPACLCTLVQSAKKAIPSINIAKAVILPKKCNFGKYVPKNYKCAGVPVPRE